MKLDFTSLEKAVESLNRAIQRSQNDLKDEEIRDAVIQRFEYTYELCWKMMKRQIEKESPSPESIDKLSFKDLLREAAEKQIISNVEDWMEYRESRNITAHTYNAQKAKIVYQSAVKFNVDAANLLKCLKSRP